MTIAANKRKTIFPLENFMYSIYPFQPNDFFNQSLWHKCKMYERILVKDLYKFSLKLFYYVPYKLYRKTMSGSRRHFLRPVIQTCIYSTITVFITFCLIKFPDDALEASIRGLSLWWEVVFPSLLPFFITAEMLTDPGLSNLSVSYLSQLCDRYLTSRVLGVLAG